MHRLAHRSRRIAAAIRSRPGALDVKVLKATAHLRSRRGGIELHSCIAVISSKRMAEHAFCILIALDAKVSADAFYHRSNLISHLNRLALRLRFIVTVV